MWVIYVESIASKSYDIKTNIPNGNYEVTWTDAMTGKLLAKTSGNGTIVKAPPALSDKVVIIKSVSK